MSDQPSELAITLASLPNLGQATPGWVTADEVRHRLKRLFGFDCTSQFVAATLARMARTDAPWVERRENPWGGPWEYRVTRFGFNDIDNKLSSLKVIAR